MPRLISLCLLFTATLALAQEAAAPDAGTTPPVATSAPAVKVTPTGYVEAYYGFNFNQPSNGITNLRGFDNRHNSFTLSNVAAGANLEAGPIGARLMLQVGATPSTYYLSEPALNGSGGANASGPDLWKYLQEAYVTYKAPVGRGLLLQLGLCASPVGYEVIPAKDNWNWSRSDLFFGFPFYHAGLRATYEWSDQLSTTVSVFNGWNSVVDNNKSKSVEANVNYKIPDRLQVQLLYFGGVERPTGAPEGQAWRHHFDLTAQYDATSWLSLAGQGDYGWEDNRFGTASWAAGALYAHLKPVDRFAFTLRGDVFHEGLASSSAGTSSAIFWGGVDLIGSLTATAEFKPIDNLAVRLEYRHDFASGPLFFQGAVEGDGSAADPYVPNARAQDTLVLGATAWF